MVSGIDGGEILRPWKKRAIAAVLLYIVLYILMGTSVIPRNAAYYVPLAAYGDLVAFLSPYRVVNGIKVSESCSPWPTIVATPEREKEFEQWFAQGPEEKATIVVCSSADAWVTQHLAGSRREGKLRRIIVFDGGHHLPTLATMPDVILLPVVKGMAAHSYMHDAIDAEAVEDLLRRLDSPTVVVEMPRMGLVKSEPCLRVWARRAAAYVPASGHRSGSVTAGRHYAIKDRTALVYIQNLEEARLIMTRLTDHKPPVEEVVLAVDYGRLTQAEARSLVREWRSQTGATVTVVNTPETSVSLMFGGRGKEIPSRL